MHPLHQAVFLTQVVLLLVTTIGIVAVAVVAIARYQGGHVVGQTSAERETIGTPNLVHCLFQGVGGVMSAIGVDIVIGVADLNRGAGESTLRTPGSQRHIIIVRRFFVRVRIVPRVLGDPKVDVVAIVKLDVPRTSVSTLGPVKLVCIQRGVKWIRAATEMGGGSQARIQGHPVQHVVGAGWTTHRRFGMRQIGVGK